jgi:L-cysteine/cystine lyase
LDIGRIRDQIPTCQKMTYMNTGWSGPSPISVVEAIARRLEYESYEGPTSPPVQQSGKEIHQSAIAAAALLLNVSPQEVCITQNTTDGLNTALNGLPWQEGDEVITFSLEHSSVLVPAYYLQRSRGVRVIVLPLSPAEEPESIVRKVEAAITSRTRLVFFSHIQYTSGLRMPVEAIRKVTKERGVWMLLDGAQTAGQIALDLRALDCEFYAVPSQKWLLGPDGIGALYIREDMIPMVEPMKVAGHALLSHDDEGNFDVNDASMDKFLLTTRSMPLCAGFTEAVKFVREAGFQEIEARALALARQLKAALSEIPGVTVVSPTRDDISCGLTAFRVEGVEPDEAVTRLWEDHEIVLRQVREMSCIRASTHFFNTEEEIGTFVDAVRGLAR